MKRSLWSAALLVLIFSSCSDRTNTGMNVHAPQSTPIISKTANEVPQFPLDDKWLMLEYWAEQAKQGEGTMRIRPQGSDYIRSEVASLDQLKLTPGERVGGYYENKKPKFKIHTSWNNNGTVRERTYYSFEVAAWQRKATWQYYPNSDMTLYMYTTSRTEQWFARDGNLAGYIIRPNTFVWGDKTFPSERALYDDDAQRSFIEAVWGRHPK